MWALAAGSLISAVKGANNTFALQDGCEVSAPSFLGNCYCLTHLRHRCVGHSRAWPLLLFLDWPAK